MKQKVEIEIDVPEGMEFDKIGYMHSSIGWGYYPVFKPKRWRAKEGDSYWMITERMIPFEYNEKRENLDNDLWDIGNYFKTEEEAQKMADKIKELLMGEK